MAPERINGEKYGTPADIWSLGMIVIECATGSHPHKDAQSYFDLVMEISECTDPPRLSTDTGQHSAALAEFVSACLAPAAGLRPTTLKLLTSYPFLALQMQGRPQEGTRRRGERSHDDSGDGDNVNDNDAIAVSRRAAAAASRLRFWLGRTFEIPTVADAAPDLPNASASHLPRPQVAAAMLIQARYRGFRVRTELAELNELEEELRVGALVLD